MMIWGKRSGIPLRILCLRRLRKRRSSGRALIVRILGSMHNVWTILHLKGLRSRAYLLERCQKSANEKVRLISNPPFPPPGYRNEQRDDEESNDIFFLKANPAGLEIKQEYNHLIFSDEVYTLYRNSDSFYSTLSQSSKE